MQQQPLCIIYVNYNNWLDLKESLQSVFKTEGRPFLICIADNNSSDGSILHLQNWLEQEQKTVALWTENSFENADKEALKQVNLISLNVNYGFGKANNIVLNKFIDHPYFILLLNPDVLIRKDCLHYFYNAAASDIDAIYGASVFNYFKKNKLMYNGGLNINKYSGTINFNTSGQNPEVISGGCMFIHSSILKKVGLFPDDYFLYWEDAVLCKKAKEAGFKIRTAKGAIAFDKGSTTIGKGFLAEYYYSRNALRYIKNHHPYLIPLVLFFNIFRGFKRIIFLKFDKLKAVYKATLHFLKDKDYDVSEIYNNK